MLFYTITEGAEKVPVSHFISVSSLIYTHTESYNFFTLAVVKVCKLNITVYGQQLGVAPHIDSDVMGSVTITILHVPYEI